MSSYVYMKILESQPRRYDLGMALLTRGRLRRAKERVVAESISPGDRVLEIGCGTGTAAILAASAGAQVTGFDISEPMLAVAREKVAAESPAGRVELIEMGISGMDRFPDEQFDAVISTLVFSELSPDEQDYALAHAFRALKPGGWLAIADEARPETFLRRLVHAALRFPFALLTFVVAQTTTRAVDGLPERVRRAGFRIVTEERTALGSMLYLRAVKGER